jgi:hypothetical protein
LFIQGTTLHRTIEFAGEPKCKVKVEMTEWCSRYKMLKLYAIQSTCGYHDPPPESALESVVVTLKYKDPENDWLMIGSPEELEYAVELNREQGCLKVAANVKPIVNELKSPFRIGATACHYSKGVKLFPGVVGYFDGGGYLSYGPIDFGSVGTYKSLRIRYAKGNGIGSGSDHVSFLLTTKENLASGPKVATFKPKSTGGWTWKDYKTAEIPFDEKVEGSHYLTLLGNGGAGIVNLQWLELFA